MAETKGLKRVDGFGAGPLGATALGVADALPFLQLVERTRLNSGVVEEKFTAVALNESKALVVDLAS